VRISGRRVQMEGHERASIWVIEDLSESQRAEKALREAHERLEIAQDAGHIGIFDIHLREERAFWSRQLIDIYGLQQAPGYVDRAQWAAYMHPDDAPGAQAHLPPRWPAMPSSTAIRGASAAPTARSAGCSMRGASSATKRAGRCAWWA
jgi:PAS domain-containing protein